MKVISIANQKGGVGKTTTTINLGASLAAAHKKVLIIDFDPQGNASTGLGKASYERENKTIYHVLSENLTIKEAIQSTLVPNLDILCGSEDLSGLELEIIQSEKREFYLKNAIHNLQNEYDYILIDCPPTLGLLTLNSFVASQSIIIPLQCEFYSLEGLSQLLKIVQRIQKGLNTMLEIQGVVLTMYDKRSNSNNQVEKEVRQFFKDKVYNTVIPRNIRVSEAPSHGKPVIFYDFKCPGSQSYIHLAKEILLKEEQEYVRT